MKPWMWAGLAVVVWFVFFRTPSPAAALAAEVASGGTVQVPEFGTDDIISAADAVAVTGSLPLPMLTLSTSTRATNASQ